MRIIDKNINEQTRALYRKEGGGNIWRKLGAKGKEQVLTDEQILELSELIVKIENHYGFPCDIEWAYEGSKFYIVQSRPITTLQNISITEDITSEITRTDWFHLGKWIEPALAAEVWLEYAAVAQQFFKEKLDQKILYLNGDFFLSQHDSDIFQNEGYEAAKRHDKKFFENIYREVQKVAAGLTKKSKSITSIPLFLEEYRTLTGVWMPLNNIAVGIEKYIQETNPDAFAMTKGFLDEKPLTLQESDEMSRLKVDIEKAIGKSIKNAKDIPITYLPRIKKHVEQYEWLGTHHFNVNKLTVEKLVERMGKSKANPYKICKITDQKTAYLVWLLDLIGYARFKAAETSGITTFNLAEQLRALAKKKGLTYEEVVEHTVNEIASEQLAKKIAQERKRNTGFYFNGKEHILTEDQIKASLDSVLKIETESTHEVRGLPAQKGKVVGRVKIVTRQEQMKGFEEGMILVAYETTPDIVFAMQKSAAIVTDFGGLTSHAAIVAREFKKSCIVGTKFATKALHDGDLVEVDADAGVVRVLERAGENGKKKKKT